MSRKMLQVPVATLLVLLSLLQIADVAAAADAAGAGDATPAVVTAVTTGIDPSLKNARLIEAKVLPDLAILQRSQEDEKWQQVYRFIDDGFPVLELYGYKPKSGEYCRLCTQGVGRWKVEVLPDCREKLLIQEDKIIP